MHVNSAQPTKHGSQDQCQATIRIVEVSKVQERVCSTN